MLIKLSFSRQTLISMFILLALSYNLNDFHCSALPMILSPHAPRFRVMMSLTSHTLFLSLINTPLATSPPFGYFHSSPLHIQLSILFHSCTYNRFSISTTLNLSSQAHPPLTPLKTAFLTPALSAVLKPRPPDGPGEISPPPLTYQPP